MNALAKKLQIKPGTTWLLINAPEGYQSLLDPLPDGVNLSDALTAQPNGVQLFVKNSAELVEELKTAHLLLKPDTIFWITYPKKSSGVKTDLEMMGPWEELGKYGLDGVSAVSVNETWTALRFKPKLQVKASESCNEEIRGKNKFSEYIDVDTKTVRLPEDALEMLKDDPAALSYFEGLAYSHKKEYVVWILEAKQEKTRLARLEKMFTMLQNKKKNPNDK
ncbi:YdeI/OmpD-associated family protein [Mucilaginibacter ginkgonis]|uniref:YdeI/OmpD-associated family protein n=1 Tax=Mucilaginibacter ginkgonis TaxID=2682091 RepID=A0A6I4I0E9_9SPHI|nr:YdeI/OmpD-associated family protein [Mucilaginibacter ginkgonis]QQL51040.1 YdeI/OmpD-associated family protein [Mucilaginibacter ginkgonis]